MIMELIGYFVFIWPLLIASIYAWFLMASDSWRVLERSLYSPWQPVVYPLKTILLICFVLFFFQTVSEVIKDIITLKRGSDEWLRDR
jgi:TRAP-type mannitol/chloroaromatic compound transport system permease small subunit